MSGLFLHELTKDNRRVIYMIRFFFVCIHGNGIAPDVLSSFNVQLTFRQTFFVVPFLRVSTFFFIRIVAVILSTHTRN